MARCFRCMAAGNGNQMNRRATWWQRATLCLSVMYMKGLCKPHFCAGRAIKWGRPAGAKPSDEALVRYSGTCNRGILTHSTIILKILIQTALSLPQTRKTKTPGRPLGHAIGKTKSNAPNFGTHPLRTGRLVDLLTQGHQLSANTLIPFQVPGYFVHAVANGAVIAPAQKFADLEE